MGFFDRKNKDLYQTMDDGGTVLSTEGSNEAEDPNNPPGKAGSGEGGDYPILLRGAVLRCSAGSHARRLNLPFSHGVYYKGCPVVHEEDQKVGDNQNIRTFGICSELTKEWGSGGWTQRITGDTVLLERETVDPANPEGGEYQEAGNVRGAPCKPIIVGNWHFVRQNTLLGKNRYKGQKNADGETIDMAIESAISSAPMGPLTSMITKAMAGAASIAKDQRMSKTQFVQICTTNSCLVCKHGGIIRPYTTGEEVGAENANANENPSTGAPQEDPAEINPNPNEHPGFDEAKAWELLIDTDLSARSINEAQNPKTNAAKKEEMYEAARYLGKIHGIEGVSDEWLTYSAIAAIRMSQEKHGTMGDLHDIFTTLASGKPVNDGSWAYFDSYSIPETQVGGRTYSEHSGNIDREWQEKAALLSQIMDVDYSLLVMTGLHETSFDTSLKNPSGAAGVMQVMPANWNALQQGGSLYNQYQGILDLLGQMVLISQIL